MSTAFVSRTGSSRGVMKQNGEIIAVPHKTVKKSYNDNSARADLKSTTKESFKDPNVKQQLSKYDHNALRNRLPVVFKGEAEPYKRFCQPRNMTSADFQIGGHVEAGYQRFRTTFQNFYDYDTSALEVGETNQGIVSEATKNIHAKQLK